MKKLTQFNISDEYKDQLASKEDFTSMATRVERAEAKNLEQELRLEYLEGRQGTVKDSFIDLFLDGKYSNNKPSASSKEVKAMFDIGENFTWKQRENSDLWTNGIIRNPDQNYMLEVMDEYNLEGVGQVYKGPMKYDAVNKCYWMQSYSGINALGEITKLSENMQDGRVEVLGRWYLPAGGANTYWSGGIAVNQTGTKLFLGLSSVAASKIYGIDINSDGTLGVSAYKKKNGETIDITNSIYASSTDSTASSAITDIFSYSETEIGYLLGAVALVSSKFLLISNLGAGSTTTITGFGSYVGNSIASNNKAADYKDGILFIRMDSTTDDKRFIYKFNMATDIVSNVVIKSSGRFENTRNVDGDSQGGICFSHDGNLLEVVSTASNGKFIAKRALKNALWAENQVCGEYKIPAAALPVTPLACMVEGQYRWTGDQATTAAQVDIYRYDTLSSSYKSARIVNAGYTGLYDLCTDGTNLWLLMYNPTGTLHNIWYGLLSSFIALMSNNIAIGASITLGTTWGTAVSGGGFVAANVKYELCFDSINSLVYVVNGATSRIDTLTLAGVYTAGVYFLPAATSAWNGIAYKNGTIYIREGTNTAVPYRVYALPVNKQGATTWYRSHIYQDPSKTFVAAGVQRMDFFGNDLTTLHLTDMSFYTMKTLEDPDVMQLHTFMDANNILLTNNVSCSTAIAERYFEPEQFADIRDCPDKNYMAVGYGDEGFTLLHLDKFLSGRSNTGKPRYDVRDIRTQHYKDMDSLNGLIYSSGTNITSTLFIEKDIIFVGVSGTTGWSPFFIIDLKSGVACQLNTAGFSGLKYLGSLSERNDTKGRSTTVNEELALSSALIRKIHARTFTKEDASDYSGENPKTFVAIGTDGGCDLLIIDWDATGNRTPVKVWNNVWNDAAFARYALWIAPSGDMFGGAYVATGAVGKSVRKVWNIASDNYIDSYTPTGSNILGGFAMDISPNSRCWKTPSGTWRHQLICGTFSSATATFSGATIVDVENATKERVFGVSTSTSHGIAVDCFEGKIFSSLTDFSGSVYFGGLKVFSKQRFNSKGYVWLSVPTSYNMENWETCLDSQFIQRPYFMPFARWVSGDNGYLSNAPRYSNKHGLVALSSYYGGLQIFHFPRMTGTRHVSTEIDTTAQDVSEVYYKEYTVEGY